MISITKLKSHKSRGAGAVVAYMQATEYYADKGIGLAKWEGEGAKRLGLENRPNADEDFGALLQGKDPMTKQKLGKGKQGNLMGLDLTFNAPKAFTLGYVLADEELKAQILKAHTEARQEALAFLLEQPLLRRGKDGVRVEKADAPIMRVVTHIDNRNGEAHLHDHCVLIAKAQASDGTWLKIDNAALVNANHAASALYDRAFAERMEALGFTIEKQRHFDGKGKEKPHVSYHIAGLSQDLEDATSSRSREASEFAREHGLSMAEAILRTRQAKDEGKITVESVLARTRNECERFGLYNMEQLKGHPATLEKRFDAKDQEQILKHLHRSDSAFSRFELIDALTKEGYAKPLETADAWLKEHCHEFENSIAGSPLYCSKAQYALELSLVERGKARADEVFHHLEAGEVEAGIKAYEQSKGQGFKLSDEQREAVYFATMKTGGIACIEGFAGAGKSASAGAYCRAFEGAGFKMLGTSSSTNATDNLATEAGIEAYNCEKLLGKIDGGKITLTPKHVLVVDEAGMVDASTMARLQKAVDNAGAKMILVGDTFQLQPIGAGQAFRLISDENGKFQQTEIKRQKWDEGLQQAKDFYNGKSGESIVKDWKKKGTLTEHGEKAEAVSALVSDYFASKAPIEQRLVLVNTNADALFVSKQLRHGLFVAGQLDPATDRRIQIQDPENQGKTIGISVAVGERLRFTDTYKDKGAGLEIANNSKGTVLGFTEGKEGLSLRMKLETSDAKTNGKEVEIPLAKFKHYAYGWTSTNHSAQGLGADDVFWLDGGGRVDRNMALVAFTRSKQSFKAYTTDAESLGEHMEEWGKKPSASELKLKTHTPELQQLGEEIASAKKLSPIAHAKLDACHEELIAMRRETLIKRREQYAKDEAEAYEAHRQARSQDPSWKAWGRAKKAREDAEKEQETYNRASLTEKAKLIAEAGLRFEKLNDKTLAKKVEDARALEEQKKAAFEAWRNAEPNFRKGMVAKSNKEQLEDVETRSDSIILQGMTRQFKDAYYDKKLSKREQSVLFERDNGIQIPLKLQKKLNPKKVAEALQELEFGKKKPAVEVFTAFPSPEQVKNSSRGHTFPTPRPRGLGR